MSVTNQPSSRPEQQRANDYQIMHHVGEFTRSAAYHTGSVLGGLLMIIVAVASLALFWVVATMLGVI
ncbi:MAG: hypothetical protein JO001_28110 [Alphaproteobacteria bacterium]|nr:hypothetical protein [Alphaproteobacteria bacterium]